MLWRRDPLVSSRSSGASAPGCCSTTAGSIGLRSVAWCSPIARRAPTSKRSSTRSSTAASTTGLPICLSGTRVALADIPLLFETGHQHDFERVVVCACDAAEQLRRLVTRDRLTAAEARARLAAQWPIAEKVRRADYVIRTDGTFAETEAQVRQVYEVLAAEA